MGILIKNGRIVNPATNFDQIADLLIEDDKVVAIENDIDGVHDVVDATDMVVVPGFVDLHVHLREPGFEVKETIETGTRAAVAGGVTTVVCMPNTKPTIHNANIVKQIQDKARDAGYAKVKVAGAITKDIAGKELADIDCMIDQGIVSISDDGRTTSDVNLMSQAFKKIKKDSLILMAHTEDDELADGGCMNKGNVSESLGLQGIPNEAESNIVHRDINLCREANSKLHICHVSTEESMNMIKKAKSEGVNVTVEICPHHFILTDDIVKADNAYSKVNPPIRSKKDRDYMLQCLREGSIDCIVTDHAPHEDATKKVPYNKAAFGISGIETSFALSYTYLVKQHIISFNNLIELMSVKPSSIINQNTGDISVGHVADIAIIDLNHTYKINSQAFISKGKNTPFDGFEVSGIVNYTFVDGRMVYRRSLCQ